MGFASLLLRSAGIGQGTGLEQEEKIWRETRNIMKGKWTLMTVAHKATHKAFDVPETFSLFRYVEYRIGRR
jgi:hypothetical protein